MNRAHVWRLALLAAMLGVCLWVRYGTAFGASLSTARIRELVQHAGAAGVAIYLLAFTVGELLHIPGLVFVGAAVLSWGRLGGGVVAYVGALVSLSLSFLVVRGIGGKALADVQWKWRPVRALLARLDRQPIATIALLRLILWIAPALNYALALSAVRFRDYLAGSAIGLLLPVAILSLVVERLLR